MPELKDLIKIFKYVKTLNECCKDTNNTTYSCAVQKDKENCILVDAYFKPESYTKTSVNYSRSDKPYQFINAYMEDLRYFKMLDPPVDYKYWKATQPLDNYLKAIIWTTDGNANSDVDHNTIFNVMNNLYVDTNPAWKDAVGGGLNLNNIISLSKKEQSGFVPYEVYDLKGSYTDEYLNQMNSKIKKYYNLFGGFKKVSEEVTGSITDLDNLLRNDLENQVMNSLNKKYYKDYKVTSQTGGSGSKQVEELWNAYWAASNEDKQIFDCIAFFRYRTIPNSINPNWDTWKDLNNDSTKPTNVKDCEIRVNLKKLPTAQTPNQKIFQNYFRTHNQNNIPNLLMILPDDGKWDSFVYFASNYWLGLNLDNAPAVSGGAPGPGMSSSSHTSSSHHTRHTHTTHATPTPHTPHPSRPSSSGKPSTAKVLSNPPVLSPDENPCSIDSLPSSFPKDLPGVSSKEQLKELNNAFKGMLATHYAKIAEIPSNTDEERIAQTLLGQTIEALQELFSSYQFRLGLTRENLKDFTTIEQFECVLRLYWERSGDLLPDPRSFPSSLPRPSSSDLLGGGQDPHKIMHSKDLLWWRNITHDPNAAANQSKIFVNAAHLHRIWNCDDDIFDKIADINQIDDDELWFNTGYEKTLEEQHRSWKVDEEGNYKVTDLNTGKTEEWDTADKNNYKKQFNSAEKCFNSYLNITKDKCCDVIEKLLKGDGKEFLKEISAGTVTIGALDENFKKQNPFSIKRILKSFKWPEILTWDPFIKGKLYKYPNFDYWAKNVLPHQGLDDSEVNAIKINKNLKAVLNMCVAFVNHNPQLLNPHIDPFEGTPIDVPELKERGVHYYSKSIENTFDGSWQHVQKRILKPYEKWSRNNSLWTTPIFSGDSFVLARGGGQSNKGEVILTQSRVMPDFSQRIWKDLKYVLNNLKTMTNKSLKKSEIDEINKLLNNFKDLELQLLRKILTINKYVKVAYAMNDNRNEVVSINHIKQQIAEADELINEFSTKDLELKNVGFYLGQFMKDKL